MANFVKDWVHEQVYAMADRSQKFSENWKPARLSTKERKKNWTMWKYVTYLDYIWTYIGDIW